MKKYEVLKSFQTKKGQLLEGEHIEADPVQAQRLIELGNLKPIKTRKDYMHECLIQHIHYMETLPSPSSGLTKGTAQYEVIQGLITKLNDHFDNEDLDK